MIIKDFVKVYSVQFNEYTNSSNDTVTYYKDGNAANSSLSNTTYISIPKGGLLLLEDELEEYRKFGNGYESIKFVGSLPVIKSERKERETLNESKTN